MTSVESGVVMVDEEEEEDEEVPSGTPSPSTTTPPSLFFILKPGQVSHGGQDQDILLTNQDRCSAAPGTPAVTAQGLPPMAPKGSTVEAASLQSDLSATSTCKGVTVTLRNSHMWNEFHGCRTEMILTKQGRRMFPYCSFSIAGLEPLKRYVMVMDIAPMDNSRWKWNGREWEACGKAEPHVLDRVFIHPDSPCLGHCLTQSSVSFYKLKLTNNTQDTEGHIILHSMHRYLPRLHLVPAETDDAGIELSGPDVATFTFPQTEFIAVTTYQNLRITQLKINCNPFAKGFREEGPFSQLSRPRAESSDPLLSLELNSSDSSNTKLRDLQKTLQLLFRPSEGLDKAVEQELQQTVCTGAEFLNGVQSVLQAGSVIRGEKRPNPAVRSERNSKLKVRRVDPKRRNGAYAEKETEPAVDNVSREARLKNQSCIAGEATSAVRVDRAIADRPSLEGPTAPEANAAVSSEREDSCGTPALSPAPQREAGSTAKAEPMAVSSEPLSTFPTSLSLSQKSSPDSRMSLHPFSQSPAVPVLTPVSKPLSAGSDKGASLRSQATPGGKVNLEAATPGTTPLSSTSTWKRKQRSKRKRSRKCKKYVKKSGVGAQKVPEPPVEAAMLPDLEDVEGMLFVSFVSKEALGAHLQDLPLCREEHVPLPEQTGPPKKIEVVETLEEKIARLQDLLLLDLQRLKHRQVIHTVLQEVGLKLSLLDPTLAIDLQYLGVRLPLPLPLFSPEDDEVNAGLTPSPEGAPFLSRTGKTKDFTKIKGWREKFVTSEISPLKLAGSPDAQPGAGAEAGADAGADAGLRNRSAFCSDMLDEYLEREAPLMDKQAAGVSAPSSPPLVLYQLPTKSSSYIRPLHTVLSKQAPKPAPLPGLPLKPLPTCPQAKPKPKRAFGPGSAKAPALAGAKGLLHGAKAAAKSPAATKKAPPPPPSPPTTKPRPPEAGAKPDYTAARRALAKVMLKLMDLEDRALWEGYRQTTVTNERAERALAALLTAQGTLKRSRGHGKSHPRWSPPCRRAFCRLGCVCASLAKGRRVVTHCRRPVCMFGCSCLKHKMVLVRPSLTSPPEPERGDLIGQKAPGEAFPSNPEPEQGDVIGQKTPGEVFPSNSELRQCDLIGQKAPGEAFPSNSEPEQGDLIGQKAPGEVFASNSELKQCDLIGQKAPGEAFPSNSEPEQGDLIGQKAPGEAFPSNSEPKQGDLIGQKAPGEAFPSNSEPKQGDLIGQKAPGEAFPSNSEPKQGDLIGQKAPGEAFSSSSEPKQGDLIGQKATGEAFPSNSEPKQGDLIGQKAPGEAFPSNSEPKQGDLIGQKAPGEAFPSNSEPKQGDLIGQKAPGEAFPSNSEPKQGDLIGQKAPGEAFPSNSEPKQGDLIGQKAPGEAFPSNSEPKQGDLIGQKAPGEPFPSNFEPEQGDLIKEEVTGAGCPSACEPEQGDLVALEMIDDDSTSYCKRKKKKKKKKKKRKRERLSYAILEAETEVELEVELPVHLHRLWNRKAGEVDPEPLYVPTPVRFDAPLPSADFRVPKPAPFRTYVPRPNPVVRDEDKDPVYLYFESMMTCARVRGYMSKPPPERPLCFCKSVLCSGKEDDPYHYSIHLTAERRPPKDKARLPGPRQAPEEARRTLEVLSECDWESERGPVLAAVCQRAAAGDLARPFRVGAFLVRPFGPALGREGHAGPVAHKVLISRGRGGESPPSDRREAPRRDRAAKGFPFWSDVLPAGLLSAKKKQPGLPAKGLIEVNGKSYSQAKVQLGQMGALHMTSRLAAYLTGRWQPANQKRPVKAPPVSKLIGRGSHESPTSLPACPAGTVTLGSTIAALGTSGPGFHPLVSPVAPMLLVPVEDPDSDSAAPASAGSLVPLVPGEGVVLHPVHGPSGTPLFRHPSGRLVHLVPLDQLHPAPPDPPASSPDAVAHLPQASPPACESASADTGAPSHSPTTPAPPPCPTETAAAAVSAAPKPAPSFLGQRGTRTIRICPGVAGGARSKGPAPAGFTPLHVPRGTPPRAPRKEAEPPGKGPRSPESGTPEGPGSEPRPPAETDSGGPGRSASSGERRSHGATPRPDETHQLHASAPVRRPAATALVDSAQTAGSAQGGSWVSERRVLLEDVSEDSEEDVAGMMSDAELEVEQEADDDVDVETMEELPEEKSTAAAQEKLTQAELIRQADSQSELDTSPQAQQLEANGERVSRTESERRRRNQMTDLFTRLQDVLGIQSVSKISRVYVLSRALEEIQALVDECNRLEAKKRRMTRQREGYIKEIAQSSGTVTHLPQPLPPAYESASSDARADSPSPAAPLPLPPPCPAETAASARTPERASRKCTAASSETAGGAQGGSWESERRVLLEDVSEGSEEDGAGETSDAESEVQQETDAVNVETLEELPEKSTTLSMTAGAAQKKQTEAKLIRQADSQAELDTNLAARLSHTESERRRRNQMTDLLTRLQDVLGIQSVSKISMVYVLSRALEEIQALEDHCCILEERKRSMTRKRAGYIRKIAQRSGKPEELISLKLQDICAKQRSLESKKRKAQQRAPEPDRKQSPPTPASETDTAFLPKIVSVMSLATSPVITTPAREQDLQAVFESAQTAVSPEGSQSGDLLGDHPPTPSPLQKEGGCS